MPSHPMAHMEAEDTQSIALSELVTIQRMQANLDLEPPIEDEKEPEVPVMSAQEAWSEADSDEP